MERLAYFKAVVSFNDCNRTAEQLDKILIINNQKERLIALKKALEYMLCDLSADEQKLIEEKFFNKTKDIGDGISIRQYYRKQKLVFDKLLLKFNKRGFDQHWFEENFGDIYFLKSRYLTIKKMARKKSTKNRKTIINL